MMEIKESGTGKLLLRLRGDTLSSADLHGAGLRNANLYGQMLAEANLSGADLSGATLIEANLNNADLSRASLVGANLGASSLRGARLEQAVLSNGNLFGAVMTQANLSNADLKLACLIKADLTGAVLTGATLSGAELADARLVDADLTGSNLSQANLAGANLTGAGLTGTILTGARFDGHTRWPTNFDSERHGAIRLERTMPQTVYPEYGIWLIAASPGAGDADLQIDAGRSKLGGSPDWIQGDEIPRCPVCAEAMNFVGQIDSIGCIDNHSRASGAYVFGDCGMIFIFFCPNGDCNEAKAVLQFHFEPEEQGATRLEKAWPERTYPEYQIRLIAGSPRERADDGPIDVGGSKLGGLPDWIQNEEIPPCPCCDQPMTLIAQIDSIGCVNRKLHALGAYIFSDCGMIYVFFCCNGDCNEVRAILQFH